ILFVSLGVVVVASFALSIWFNAGLGDADHDDGPTRPPQRIVSLAPSTTEVLFAIGAGDQVVGVSTFTNHPPAAATLPKLGGHLDPDLESLAALDPDCIVTMGVLPRVGEHANALDIQLVEVPMDTLEQVYAAIATLGELTDRVDEANALRAKMVMSLGEVRDQATRRSPTVVLLVGREPGRIRGLYGAGPGSFLDDALDAA